MSRRITSGKRSRHSNYASCLWTIPPWLASLPRACWNLQGHKVDVVVNGNQAVAAETSASYDIILMDVHMPEMDGIEATITLRASGCTLPILALSGTVTSAEFRECLDAGMNGVLEKPFTLDAFEHEFGRSCKPTVNSETPPVR